jgi:PAS domain S-box-containing protein
MTILPDKNGKASRLLSVVRNIAAWIKPEESLRRYELISGYTRDIVIFIKPDGSIFEANAAAVAAYGYSREELLNLRISDLHVAGDGAGVFSEIARNDKKGVLFETVHRRKDGSVFPVEISTNGAGTGDGRLLINIIRDITERRETRKILAKSEEKYRLITQNMSDMVSLVDMDNNYLYINSSTERILGFTLEELNALPPGRLMNPASRDLVKRTLSEKCRPEMLADKDCGISFDMVLEMTRKDGSGVWVENRYNLIRNEDGTPSSMMIIGRDITERKKTQEKITFHANILDNVHDAVIVFDTGGNITYLNDKITGITGYDLADMKGKIRLDMVPGLTDDIVSEILSGVSRRGYYSGEWEITTREGNNICVGVSIGLMKDSDMKPNGYVAIVRDITERRIMEEELRTKTAFLEAQLNATIDGVLVADNEGRIILENESNKRLWGFSHKNLPFIDLHNRIQYLMTKVQNPEYFRDSLLVAFSDREIVQRDELKLTDGTVMERYSAPVLGEDGKYYGRIWDFHDITQHKKNEEALRESERQLAAIIQFLPVATMVINLNGEVVAWNKAMESLTGVKACDILCKGNYEYALPFYGERRPVLIDLVMNPDADTMKRYTKKSEKIARASLKEKETLLKEIHHRVKNNMQVISSLLALQSQFVHAKEDEQLFQNSQDRIRSMALVYNKLYQSKTLATISMKEYIAELATNLVNSYSFTREGIGLKIDVGEVLLGIEHAIPCGLIINELLVNSIKHAFPGGGFGEIQICMHRVEKMITIEVSDNGIGLPPGFEVAFSPTLGVGLVQSLGEDQLGGSVEFMRLERGTRVCVIFNIS